ncbi:MAG: MarR family transcriptional regulator [Pseudomonadota bacterium]
MPPRAKTAAATTPAPVALGPLPNLVGYGLRRAQIAVFQDFVQTMAALDIRPAQFSVLLLIELNPGINQTQISEALGIKTANLAVMLNALAARGYAERRPGTADRRAHALYLTRSGRTVMRQLQARVAEHERRIVDRLGATEKQLLLRLLAKLT